MAKFTALFTIAALLLLLLLSSELTSAVRPEPAAFTNTALETTQHQDVGAHNLEDGEVSCQGLNEEECLMRRTLVAHVDYIYTQRHNKP